MGAVYPALSIVFVCIIATLVTEFLCYVLVYSNENFYPLQEEIKLYNQKLNRLKAASNANEKKAKKEMATLTKRVRGATPKLNGLRFKTNFIMPFVFMAIFGVLGSSYDGIIVAKLPFEPFSFIRGMTGRGLTGIAEDDFDCSFLPLYVLGNMGLKPLITKLLGFTPPRSAGGQSPWEQANAAAEKYQNRQ